MDSNQTNTDTTAADKPNVNKGPPLVLPTDDNFWPRLRTFAATCNAHKWDETNINPKTKKYLPRNGFHWLLWSAVLWDDAGQSLLSLLMDTFKDNIVRITDDQFEATFGIALNPTAEISGYQLTANFFLFFALPAKSHTKYLHEWTKRRLKALYETFYVFDKSDEFIVHEELFAETKRRFYAYKLLVPKLTRHVVKSCKDLGEQANNLKRSQRFTKEMFEQIKLAISYSGLQVFKMVCEYSDGRQKQEVFKLAAVKDDHARLTANRQLIVDKYGEHVLPFARLLDIPEVKGLDQRHYPDLAFCAYLNYVDNLKGQNSKYQENFVFRSLETKTSKLELKRVANLFDVELCFNYCDDSNQSVLLKQFMNELEESNLLDIFQNTIGSYRKPQ